jgi:hypothetical protein
MIGVAGMVHAGRLSSMYMTRLPDNFRFADHPSGISVNLQVEYKQFIGNVHLVGSSLR